LEVIAVTIELTEEEANMLGDHLNHYLTLMFYEWEGTEESECSQEFLEALSDQLLDSSGGNSIRKNT
jgi:hypothetical protein